MPAVLFAACGASLTYRATILPRKATARFTVTCHASIVVRTTRLLPSMETAKYSCNRSTAYPYGYVYLLVSVGYRIGTVTSLIP